MKILVGATKLTRIRLRFSQRFQWSKRTFFLAPDRGVAVPGIHFLEAWEESPGDGKYLPPGVNSWEWKGLVQSEPDIERKPIRCLERVTFDELVRLIGTIGANSQTIAVTYDKVGNLTATADPRRGIYSYHVIF